MTLVAVLLTALSLLATLVVVLRSPLAWRRCVVRRRVIVNLTSGSAVAGVLLAQRGPLLFLRDATLHEQGRQIPVDGEAIIERTRVDWIQAVTATAD